MINIPLLEEIRNCVNKKLPSVLIQCISGYIFSFGGSSKNKFEHMSIFSICVLDDQLIVIGTAQGKTFNGLQILCLNDTCSIISPINGSEDIYFIKLLCGDTKQIITVPYYSDDNIYVCDLETKSKKPLKGTEINKPVYIMDILLDGRIIFSSTNTIKIYDLITDTFEEIKHKHNDEICFLKILPDNKFVTWSTDNCIKIWDLLSKEIITIIETKDQKIDVEKTQHLTYIQKSLSMDLNEQTFIVGSTLDENLGPRLKIWDLHGKEIKTIETDSFVTCIETYCDDFIITGSMDGFIRMWDPWNLDSCILTMSGLRHTSVVNCIRALPNGNIISSSQNEMILWI